MMFIRMLKVVILSGKIQGETSFREGKKKKITQKYCDSLKGDNGQKEAWVTFSPEILRKAP